MGLCEFNSFKVWNQICETIGWKMKDEAKNFLWNPNIDLPNKTDYWKCQDQKKHMQKLEKMYKGQYIRNVRRHSVNHPMAGAIPLVYWTFEPIKTGDGSHTDWANAVPMANDVLKHMRVDA